MSNAIANILQDVAEAEVALRAIRLAAERIAQYAHEEAATASDVDDLRLATTYGAHVVSFVEAGIDAL